MLIVELTTIVHIGKYKGKLLRDVIITDIKYADWLMDKVYKEPDYSISKGAQAYFNDAWEHRNFKKYGWRNDNLNT